MWAEYGRDGVAVVSRFGRLRTVLGHVGDRVMVGLIKYTKRHHGFNVLRFITSKRLRFAWEREIRTVIWVPEWAGQGRHLDEQNRSQPKPITPPPSHVPPGLRRPVDLRHLVERIVISPEAENGTVEQVRTILAAAGLSVQVVHSALSGYPSVVTDLDEIIRYFDG